MGTAYKIHCKHCGAQINHATDVGFGLRPSGIGCGSLGDIEMEFAIRCPACMKRLNTTPEEFREQVEITYSWN